MKKIRNSKLINFLNDKTNKMLIVNLLALLVFFLLSIFVRNFIIRLIVYFVVYFTLDNFYFKVVNYFFAQDCK